MRSKYLAFVKNSGIAAIAGISVGAGVAELVNIFSDSHLVNVISSTFCECAAAYSVFLPLHIRDNRDIYTKRNGKFNWNSFAGDQLKLSAGHVIINLAYLVGRPYLAEGFLESGLDPAKASLYAGMISYSVWFAAAIPIGKLTGNIRKADPGLEDKLASKKKAKISGSHIIDYIID